MANVFKYLEYKEFLKDESLHHPEKRGFVSRLAEAAGCQRTYLSQVLHSHIHLTPEHACNIGHYLGMDELETKYFLTLVDYGRAGTERLRTRLRNELEELRRNAEDLSTRLKRPKIVSVEAQSLYYSSWLWSALHILVSSPKYQTLDEITQRIGAPRAQVLETLRGLKGMGLVRFENNRWAFVGTDIHVPRDSPLNAVNHQNWRLRAVQDAQNPESSGVHYTTVFTMSPSDAEDFKAKLLSFIEEQKKAVIQSGSEELYCFDCDPFKP